MASNKSVERALQILELISKYPEGITLADIYKQLKMPKSTVYDILQALYKEDAIYYKNPDLKTYVIGSKIFAIGQAYTKNSNFINFAKDKLKDFANKYDITVFACKRIADKVVYIYKYESPKTKIITNDIGVQMPLYSSAPGKAFLSFLNEEKRKHLLGQVKTNVYNNAEAPEYLKLLNDIKHFQEVGYVLDDGETENYIRHYAIPVYNFEDKVTGVISASGIINGESHEEILNRINEFQKIAEYISEKQGYKVNK